MACATCKRAILFGGKRVGARRYCSKKCMDADSLGRLAESIPISEIEKLAINIRAARCPSCKSQGSIDIFPSYFVYSAILYTKWRTRRQLSCRSCGRRRQAKDLAASFLLGWWGFPFGLVVTPVIILANVAGMVRNPMKAAPGKDLMEYAKLVAAREILRRSREAGGAVMPLGMPLRRSR